MCHGCVYTGSFEPDYPRTILGALHVHRIEIPYRAFLERVSPRILSLERVDYFGTTDHFSGRKKKNNLNQQNFKVFWKTRIEDRGSRIEDRGLRIEDRGIRDRGSFKNLKMNLKKK